MKYQANKIEKKWQKYWEDNNTFEAKDYDKREKFYGLVEFPYPSGDGLHTGHLRSYTALDIVCRKKRMEGFNTLYPMGMDAFGLPAENYAIKTNTHPQITTRKNIDNFVRQLKATGFAFDWSRFIETTDPKYYKWTQWIFIQMFKKGLAYKSSENINWCTSCKIGLANEEVVAGTCERCGGEVIKKEKEQWMLKITNYADRLIDGLDNINFLDTIKKQQSDWIGKSQGAEVDFAIKDSEEKLKVFTTRPDTLFGATFMVIAPEHPMLENLDIKNITEIKEYQCNVEVYDYWVDESDKKSININFINTLPYGSNKYDSIIVAVGHDKFKEITTEEYAKLSNGTPIIIDVKGIVENSTWRL